MKIRLFYHSLLSDWNHGNAHFLRGVTTELAERGHDVVVFESESGWSLRNLVSEHGAAPLRKLRRVYPKIRGVCCDLDQLDLDAQLEDADLVIVHEWNPPAFAKRIAECRRRHGFVLLFHDTHHRLATDPRAMRAFDLSGFDGVLAYGRVLRDLYLSEGLAERVWTWHEAADTRVFRPRRASDGAGDGDLVWIGNWGDDERTEELREFLIEPVRHLGIRARVHGVRYPARAKHELAAAGIDYAGWLPNFEAPEVFARFKVTVHVPRRAYTTSLAGIPTIRPFEALACGIPLVTAPWSDAEHLFRPGVDYLVARNGNEMTAHLERLLVDEAERRALAAHGLATIRARHTCAHRVDELLDIYDQLRGRGEGERDNDTDTSNVTEGAELSTTA